MIKQRVGCIFVKVWNCLIYAIGGRTDGHCERYDVNLNRWAPIAIHPEPMELANYRGVNALDTYIYIIGHRVNGFVQIQRLDISMQENDIMSLN